MPAMGAKYEQINAIGFSHGLNRFAGRTQEGYLLVFHCPQIRDALDVSVQFLAGIL